MRETQLIMGMPITVEIADRDADKSALNEVFAYFTSVDQKFSTYKPGSEIMRYNRKEIADAQISSDMKEIFSLAQDTKEETDGYFDIKRPEDGLIDPSGIVKGWAIRNAARILRAHACKNFYVDAGGDIEVSGTNAEEKLWRVGIKNPFNENEIVKVVGLSNVGIATSGAYIRGEHIYNPKDPTMPPQGIASITVIGPDAYQADRFATAAFAMGQPGLAFIQGLPGYEAYMIDSKGTAFMTKGFQRYVIQ